VHTVCLGALERARPSIADPFLSSLREEQEAQGEVGAGISGDFAEFAAQDLPQAIRRETESLAVGDAESKGDIMVRKAETVVVAGDLSHYVGHGKPPRYW